jgi:hypothetical protein
MSYRPKPELSGVPNIPDNIYYDVLITNFNSTTGTPIPIYFNENRTNPILQTTGEYDMSIIRFQVDTPDLPVFIPVITPDQSYNDLTNYIITLTITPTLDPSGSLNTTTYISQANVIWLTQDSSAPIPPSPIANGGYQSNVGDYYYSYSYQHFQQLIEAALNRAFISLQLALATAGYTGTTSPTAQLAGVLPPIFSWDTSTQCAVISTPQFKADKTSPAFETRFLDASGNIDSNPSGVKIYFNSPLYQLFTSFNATFKGVNNSITTTASGQGYYQNPLANTSIPIPSGTTLAGLNYELTIINSGGTNQILTPNTYPLTNPNNFDASGNNVVTNLFIQTFQEFSTIVNWSPIESVVFVSNTLPIVSNQIASPLIFNENQIITGDGNNSKFAQIITDIASNEQSYKPNLLYAPTAEYRMISMTGNRPLTNVDISVFWRNKLGNIFPLNLLSGGSCSLKFLFRKKMV